MPKSAKITANSDVYLTWDYAGSDRNWASLESELVYLETPISTCVPAPMGVLTDTEFEIHELTKF